MSRLIKYRISSTRFALEKEGLVGMERLVRSKVRSSDEETGDSPSHLKGVRRLSSAGPLAPPPPPSTIDHI